MNAVRLLDGFDRVLSDLDGVVYLGPEAVPGAVEALNRMRAAGKDLRFVTNNASRPAQAVSDHLRGLGIATSRDDVVGAASVAAALLAEDLEPGSRVLVVGSDALRAEVESVGLRPVRSQDEGPCAVVQGFSPELGWAELAEASYVLADPAVPWIATNPDLTIPRDRGVAPGNGAMLAAVSVATGRSPLVAGKPEPTIFLQAAHGASSAVMVGDRLDTDIEGGRAAGLATVLVLTGVDGWPEALNAPVRRRPDHVLVDLGGFFLPPKSVEVEQRPGVVLARVGDATATAEGDRLVVEPGTQSADQVWWAACTAWWQHRPDAEESTTVFPRTPDGGSWPPDPEGTRA